MHRFNPTLDSRPIDAFRRNFPLAGTCNIHQEHLIKKTSAVVRDSLLVPGSLCVRLEVI